MRKLNQYFNTHEKLLWVLSATLIFISFLLFDRENYLTLTASLIGVTSLIFCAKGNPFGQFLMVIFSLLYGVISFSFSYYGEMLTYLGMTMPMAFVSLIAWMKHPYDEGSSEVKVNRITPKETITMLTLAFGVTFIFYFILKLFHTNNLIPSTLSVTTSFLAVYLTYKRSPYYALGYAMNDLILILLWGLASIENQTYISVVVCFCMFFINDLYGYFSWKKMELRQNKNLEFLTYEEDVI